MVDGLTLEAMRNYSTKKGGGNFVQGIYRHGEYTLTGYIFYRKSITKEEALQDARASFCDGEFGHFWVRSSSDFRFVAHESVHIDLERPLGPDEDPEEESGLFSIDLMDERARGYKKPMERFLDNLTFINLDVA